MFVKQVQLHPDFKYYTKWDFLRCILYERMIFLLFGTGENRHLIFLFDGNLRRTSSPPGSASYSRRRIVSRAVPYTGKQRVYVRHTSADGARGVPGGEVFKAKGRGGHDAEHGGH